MITAIIIDDGEKGHRLVIDTTHIDSWRQPLWTSPQKRLLVPDDAYLSAQEELDSLWNQASGLFLHPALDMSIVESAAI